MAGPSSPADGSERWTRTVGFPADAPAVVDDRVAVVANEPPGADGPGPGMAGLDAETGDPVGAREAVDGAFAVGDGRVACLRGSSLWSSGRLAGGRCENEDEDEDESGRPGPVGRLRRRAPPRPRGARGSGCGW